MDGAYVAVKFPGTSSNSNCTSSSGLDPDPSSLLQDCRLLRIDELQVCNRRDLATLNCQPISSFCGVHNLCTLGLLHHQKDGRTGEETRNEEVI